MLKDNEKGKIYAFKTDTVWGFGAHPEDEIAVKKIYEIKKRDIKKPLILMSYALEPLMKYIEYIPSYAVELIEKYLPGGLTLIFKKSKFCPDYITQYETIGIRIPDSPDFLNLVKNISGGVLATTSCNVSSEPPVQNYAEAKEKFSNYAEIIKPLDDKITQNLPSTVVLCDDDEFKILRQGAIKIS